MRLQGSEQAQYRDGEAAVPAVSGARLVVKSVMDGLDAGDFAPGQRLVEADLCRRIGVGRNSVREGLQRLASDGVVELSRHKGASIRELTLEQALETIEVTELLAGLAARSAARRIDRPGAAQRLRGVLGELAAAQAHDDDGPFVAARGAFYAILVRIGGNHELRRILPAVQVNLLRAQFQLNRLQRRLIGQYQAVGQAVLAGDSVGAERLARKHVRDVRANLESQMTTTGRN